MSASSEGIRQEGKQPPKRSRFGRHFHLRLAFISIVAVVAVGLMWINLDRGGDAGPDRSVPLPVRHAVEQASMRGEFILPGVEGSLDVRGSAYRSGYVPLTDALSSALDDMFQAYQEGDTSLAVAYWLLAGYVATGQFDAARNLAESILEIHPHASRLIMLDGIIAYYDGDLERSQDRMLTAYERDPVVGAAALNLAIVLREGGNAARAQELLKGIIEEHAGTAVAARAEEILNRM